VIKVPAAGVTAGQPDRLEVHWEHGQISCDHTVDGPNSGNRKVFLLRENVCVEPVTRNVAVLRAVLQFQDRGEQNGERYRSYAQMAGLRGRRSACEEFLQHSST
jgi:hypothetical protein